VFWGRSGDTGAAFFFAFCKNIFGKWRNLRILRTAGWRKRVDTLMRARDKPDGFERFSAKFLKTDPSG
jgi:hypothetical protein